jgi:DNA-binding beta-propeller fold protein YncE
MKLRGIVWLVVCGWGAIVAAQNVSIDCVAGTGAAENNGDAGPAAEVNIGEPFGVEVGPDGALYICEVRNHRIRRLDLKTGKVTTVAGCGRRGYSGDGGPAVDAELNEPYEVRFDRDRNMYVVEMKNHIVRRVDSKTKKISTIAGTGKQGFGGDGGPATKAVFNQPHSIALDDKGAVYVADIGNHRIRRIAPETGIVDSIAGNSKKGPPKDGQTARGNAISGPRALFVEGTTLWIALREGHSVWQLNLVDGKLHHVAGIGQAGYAGDGGPAIEAKFNGPKGIAVTRDGKVFVADTENNVIRRIDMRSGTIATVDDKDTDLNRPHGVCVAPDGTLFIGDTLNHRIWRVRLR